MRKNGSRFISFKQYRLTDLLLFAVILVAFELLLHFAFIAYNGNFIFSPMMPIVLLVMMRWGWPSVFYAVGDGILYCLLNIGSENFNPAFFAVYGIGNAALIFLLLLFKFSGKRRIAEKWYFSALYVVVAWLFVCLGRSLVAVCFGMPFAASILTQLSDLLTLAISVVIILILRRLDGMFEDQKTYLLRIDKERREQMMPDKFGDEPPGEIDEESLSILRKRDEDLE